MPRPTVVVLAIPFVYASLIADALRARGTWDVIAPDLAADDWDQDGSHHAIVTSLPVPSPRSGVVIELPESFEEPLKVSVGDIAVTVAVSVDHPIDDLIAVLERLLDHRDTPIENVLRSF